MVDGEIQADANSGEWKASHTISAQTRLVHISSNLFFFSNLLFKFALSPSRNRSNEEQNKDRIKKKILKLITKNEVKEFGRIK